MAEPNPSARHPSVWWFRKKPVVVAAFPAKEILKFAAHDWDSVPPWVRFAFEQKELVFAEDPLRIKVKTLEGWLYALPTDWLICGVKGEIYPCKPDVFDLTYEPVTTEVANGD